ncbi:MAG: hypothetical protein V4755_18755 [Curtobacterium sp.]
MSSNTDSTGPLHNGQSLGGDELQILVDTLGSGLECPDRDDYRDDLTFSDVMRGFDCVDGLNTVSVRAYAHASSIDLVLDDWTSAEIQDRGVRRGEHWFVVGPTASIAAVAVPRSDPESTRTATGGTGLSAEQEFLTNCAQYSYDEAARLIRREATADADRAFYDAAFSGVADVVRSSIAQAELDRLRATRDEERWPALLSSHGEAWKRACRAAGNKEQR